MYDVFDGVKEKFLNDLSFVNQNVEGQNLLLYLSDHCNDASFLIDCHNTITHDWRSEIFHKSKACINDITKWCIFYNGSLISDAVIDSDKKIWINNSNKFKLGNTKRHVNNIFDVGNDYFLFYKIFGKYLFLEKQGLDNQVWTKDMKHLIIKLKKAEFERDNYKRLLDAKDN